MGGVRAPPELSKPSKSMIAKPPGLVFGAPAALQSLGRSVPLKEFKITQESLIFLPNDKFNEARWRAASVSK